VPPFTLRALWITRRAVARFSNCYYNQMPIWDEKKRQRNLRLHGLDFIGAESIRDQFTVTLEDIREDYGERRWVTLGMLRGEIVVLVHTECGEDDRYISLRIADEYETISYIEAAGWTRQ
jgi:uncharacterized protein